jgi:hypothetical protein
MTKVEKIATGAAIAAGVAAGYIMLTSSSTTPKTRIPVVLPSPQSVTINPSYPLLYSGNRLYTLHALGLVMADSVSGMVQVFGYCRTAVPLQNPPPRLLSTPQDTYECVGMALGVSPQWVVMQVRARSWKFDDGRPGVGYGVFSLDSLGRMTWYGVLPVYGGETLQIIPIQGDFAWVRGSSGLVKVNLRTVTVLAPEAPPFVPKQPDIQGVTYKYDASQKAFLGSGMPVTPASSPTYTPTWIPTGVLPVCTPTPTVTPCGCRTPTP